ncbi:MAG: hypothetical protein IPL52_08345 [Flavobacteriales bacterium]|nr:hypothetical protein [Flavobacteriales bacterium]
MEARTIFESPVARIEVDTHMQLVRLIWTGNATGEAYREPSMQVLNAVKEFGLKYFLSDARQMGPILYVDRAWSEKEIIPHFVEAGLKRIAIVSSSDGLNVIAVDKMVNTIPSPSPLSVAFFNDPSMAQLWLLENDGVDVSATNKDEQGHRS